MLTLKFSLGFILLSNMNVGTVYISSSDEEHQLQAGVIPIDFTGFMNDSWSHNIKQYLALVTVGTSYNKNSSGVNSPLLRGSEVFDCQGGGACYEIDLYKNLVLAGTAFDGQASGFVTVEKTPFYHIRLDLDSSFRFTSTENCSWYGIDQVSYCVCVARGEFGAGSGLVIGTVPSVFRALTSRARMGQRSGLSGQRRARYHKIYSFWRTACRTALRGHHIRDPSASSESHSD